MNAIVAIVGNQPHIPNRYKFLLKHWTTFCANCKLIFFAFHPGPAPLEKYTEIITVTDTVLNFRATVHLGMRRADKGKCEVIAQIYCYSRQNIVIWAWLSCCCWVSFHTPLAQSSNFLAGNKNSIQLLLMAFHINFTVENCNISQLPKHRHTRHFGRKYFRNNYNIINHVRNKAATPKLVG